MTFKSICGSLLFILVCLFAFALINWLSTFFINWFDGITLEKQIVVFAILGGTVWLLFKGLNDLLMRLTAKVGGMKWITILTIIVFSIINGYILIYFTWAATYPFTARHILSSAMLTTLILEILIASIYDSPGLFTDVLKRSPAKELNSVNQ